MTNTPIEWLPLLSAWAQWLVGGALVFSCLTDLRYRIVCNEICLLVLGAALMIALARGLPSTIGWIAYGLVFLTVLGATIVGMMGGGDAKLVFALLPSLSAMGCLHFAVVTCLMGGAIGVVVLVASWLLRRGARNQARAREPLSNRAGPLRQWLRHESARLRRGRSIPYVPAIAFGWFAIWLDIWGVG